MTVRNKLKRQIIGAWHETMDVAYAGRLINSERGLQVHFCHRLFRKFADPNAGPDADPHAGLQRYTFIEPRFQATDGSVRTPDLVICNHQRIIGVVELKYRPHRRPGYRKDLQTLQWFAGAKEPIKISNERYRGVDEHKSKPFELAPDAVLCWAGVYGGKGMLDIDADDDAKALGSRFLSLHALTASGKAPALHPQK